MTTCPKCGTNTNRVLYCHNCGARLIDEKTRLLIDYTEQALSDPEYNPKTFSGKKIFTDVIPKEVFFEILSFLNNHEYQNILLTCKDIYTEINESPGYQALKKEFKYHILLKRLLETKIVAEKVPALNLRLTKQPSLLHQIQYKIYLQKEKNHVIAQINTLSQDDFTKLTQALKKFVYHYPRPTPKGKVYLYCIPLLIILGFVFVIVGIVYLDDKKLNVSNHVLDVLLQVIPLTLGSICLLFGLCYIVLLMRSHKDNKDIIKDYKFRGNSRKETLKNFLKDHQDKIYKELKKILKQM